MVVLVRAPNPSPLTLTGTNSYLIDCGKGTAICVDPGPAIESHIQALIASAAAAHCSIDKIVLTHSHPDHAPAAAELSARTGAPVYAHTRSQAPHQYIAADGDIIAGGDCTLQVIETPGHTADHLAFYEPREGALFTGDTVLGEGYVVIAPPHGDMRAYQHTLHRLLSEFSSARTIYGGHGEAVPNPQDKLRDYIEHRDARERELLSALSPGPKTLPELVPLIYAGTPAQLWPAAARQLLAYLLALESEGRVRSIALEREIDQKEAQLLNPAWARLAGPDQAQLIETELGASFHITEIREYRLNH